MIGETGAEELNPATATTPGDKATWIDETHQSIIVDYPNIESGSSAGPGAPIGASLLPRRGHRRPESNER
jgi:hypothetical protein